MRKRISYLLSALIALIALTLTFIACGGGGNKTVGVTSVTMSPGALTLSVGQPPQTLTATVLPQNASNKGVTWSSSNTGAATVANGTVTAIAPGNATITVTTNDGGKTASCNVTVIIPVASISLNESAIELMQGRQFTLTETVTPADATIKDVIWNSDHPEIAAVNNGFVTAMAVGQAIITATSVQDVAKKAQCAVTVTPLVIPVTGITLNKTLLTLDIDQEETLTATVLPANATNPAITWSSDKPAIADVSQTGEVTALAAGTAAIKVASAAYPGVFEVCDITVAIPPPTVYVAGYERNLPWDYPDFATAKLWVNGAPQSLNDNYVYAYANSVFASDGNVYVAGYEQNVDYAAHVARLWVNGVPQNLSDGSRNAYANSIFVSGGDVYVAGHEQNENYVYVAKLWKNGVPQSLSDGSRDAYARSVFVSGNNVYVAGHDTNAQYRTVAKLWVNGVSKNLSDGNYYEEAHSVFVSGNDVYVAGIGSNAQFADIAKLWVNDAPQTLSNPGSRAYSVFASGGDVYVAGYDTNENYVYVAKLWKNGVPQNLSDGSRDAYARSVFVFGGNVYVAGWEENSPYEIPTLWVNGAPQNLSDGTDVSEAYSVFVK